MEKLSKSSKTSSSQKTSEKKEKKYSIFNGEYEVISGLGEGKTSRVYLCRCIKDHSKQIALKLMRQEFLKHDEASVKTIEQEIQILNGLDHKGITKILGYGSDGSIAKPSGRLISDLVYIILEYVAGGHFFDLCEGAGAMGEQGGRYFMDQLTDVVTYMQDKKVCHRDLKLENILVDEKMRLKIADFGFATYKKISQLSSYRGTKTYMAPEIREGKVYDGRKSDIFSLGVILFIVVHGIFPFTQPKKDNAHYSMIYNNEQKKYWRKIGGEALSEEFKSLIMSMLHYNPAKRPTIEEVKNHPWMKTASEPEKARKVILNALKSNKYDGTTADSESIKVSTTKMSM